MAVPARSGPRLEALKAAAGEFARWDPNPRTLEETRVLVHRAEFGDEADLALAESRFLARVQFGTAGLRALMAAGFACLNDLVVLQTTQGVESYLRSQLGAAKLESAGVVIGYDARHNSRRFAETAAAVLLHRGVPVYLYSRIVATPMVPFAVKQLGAAAGVMVTASHNPKQDNGYKLYWTNGAQIIPPHDDGVAASIAAQLRPDFADASAGSYAASVWEHRPGGDGEADQGGCWRGRWFGAGEDGSGETGFRLPPHPLLRDRTDQLIDEYFRLVSELYVWEREANRQSGDMKVTYTAMHGVGTPFARRAFEVFGLPPFVPVAEQVEPDPEFSTVKFPNPEEGRGALALAIQTAERSGSRLILANDPDADRLAVAERQPGGEWRIFNGNEIAALFADYVWQQYVRRERPTAEERGRAFMLASTVSSKFLQSMAEREGFQFHDTLTGFKWMGNVGIELERDRGLRFLFAYEVEIGFLVGNISMDKDGVRTAGVFAELANQLRLQGKNCAQHLEELYRRYGFFEMNTSYLFCGTPEPMGAIFERLRTGGPGGGYMDACGEHRVRSVRDVTRGYDSSRPGNKSSFPTMASQQMITFYFENGTVCTLRNSGTEPKLKYYVECKDAESKANARRLVDEMTASVLQHFVRPEVHGLKGKAN